MAHNPPANPFSNKPPRADNAWLDDIPRLAISFPPVLKSPISTTGDSSTKPAPSSLELATAENGAGALNEVVVSRFLLHRIYGYFCPSPFSSDQIPDDPPIRRMTDIPVVQQPEEPTMAALNVARDALSARVDLVQGEPIIVSNNSDVRNVLESKVCPLLNSYLRVRYSNRLPTPEDGDDEDEYNDFQFTQIDDVQITSTEAKEQGVFYPRWVTPVKTMNADRTPYASGFPDKILTLYPLRVGGSVEVAELVNLCLYEVKTPWAYQDLGSLYTGKLFEQGERPRNMADPLCRLLVQVWGQFHFTGPGIGFVTNLEDVIFLLPDIENRRLIISPPLAWTDVRVLACMVGMSYLAIDAKDSQEHPGDAFSLIGTLAPPTECYRITLEGVSPISEVERNA